MAGNNMSMVKRMLKLPREQSFFLFGPRGTGKSTLLRQSDFLSKAIWIDLLSQAEEDRFARNPDVLSEIAEAVRPDTGWIVIDEIQKVPRLLESPALELPIWWVYAASQMLITAGFFFGRVRD